MFALVSTADARFGPHADLAHNLLAHGVGERRLRHSSQCFEKSQSPGGEQVNLAGDQDGDGNYGHSNEPCRTFQS
jgi:hypothetical protein